MRRLERILLPVLGVAAFLTLWQTVVTVTRPALVRRPTLAFSEPRSARTSVVVLGDRGTLLARETLPLDESRRATSAARLRLWLGSLQPTLAAMPPDMQSHPELAALLHDAQHDFGGGLETREIVVTNADDDSDEALRRAHQLQDAMASRPSWLPGPLEATTALARMVATGEMLRHIVASLFRVATGFALAVGLGIPFGLALGSFARLSAFTNAVIQSLRPISPIAWLPVATLALGGGDVAAIFLIFLAAFFPIAVSTAAAVATVDSKYVRSAHNFGVHGLAMAWEVVLPAALPSILTALRIALGIAWVVVVAAEMLGVESGLGFLVLDARNQLRYDRVVAAMIVIGFIGLALDTTVRRFERTALERRGLGAR